MIARKLPALLAIPLLALGIALVAGAGLPGLGTVLGSGPVLLATTIVTLVFGAWLSRVVLSTGIAESIVTFAAEFGGDRPMVVALVLCAAVALLFTSVTGLGAIIMIGTIVLPVMMTVGVPRTTAATLFLLAFGIGYIFNIAQWTFYRQLFGVDQSTFGAYVWVLAAINVAVLIVYAIVRARTTRDYATFAIAAPPEARRRVHPLALLTPILPLVLYKALGLDALTSFAIAALYGTLLTKPRDAVQTLVAALIRGVEDVAPALVLMIGIGMLLAAARLPTVQGAVAPLVAAAAPRSPLAYVFVFGILSPLALYRGPLNIYGVGVGVFTVLATMHVVPAAALVAAVMAVVQVQNVCDPTNTQNVWVANFTGVSVATITRLTLPFQAGVATLATIAVVLFSGGLFGTPLCAPRRPPPTRRDSSRRRRRRASSASGRPTSARARSFRMSRMPSTRGRAFAPSRSQAIPRKTIVRAKRTVRCYGSASRRSSTVPPMSASSSSIARAGASINGTNRGRTSRSSGSRRSSASTAG